MPAPVEIVDDLTPTVLDGKLVYTVRKPPYLDGSVSVYRNGMLQDKSFFVETDSILGTVTVCEPILLRDEEDFAIHISYSTFEAPFINPQKPIHICQLKRGDVVRVALKAGMHLEPVVSRRGEQAKLLPRTGAHRAARTYSRTVFLGFVTDNDCLTGQMNLQVEHRSPSSRRETLAATVPFKNIQVIQKYSTPAKRQTDPSVPFGGGPRAKRRPGLAAKGLFDSAGFMNLVRVFF